MPLFFSIPRTRIDKTRKTISGAVGLWNAMADESPNLSTQKREMEKKLHEVLLEFEKNTGLAVISIEIRRIDEGRVLPITSEALKTKVELIS
jgi:hypothetical protein